MKRAITLHRNIKKNPQNKLLVRFGLRPCLIRMVVQMRGQKDQQALDSKIFEKHTKLSMPGELNMEICVQIASLIASYLNMSFRT